MLSARHHFPALADKIFLDAACVSIAPRPAVEAVQRFLELAMLCPHDSATAHHIFMDDLRSAARPAAARLIHSHEDEIALVESTSHALALVANAIPLESGDRVLLSDLEFMQVAIPWVQKRKDGVEIDVVPNRNGEVLVSDFAERMTARTRVVAISSVQWTNGFRVDLQALSRLCRERGVWLVVDAIQQLGAIPIDVRTTPVDFLACGGHKWLNAPYGCGFLYIRRDVLPRLHPPLAGYLSVETPAGGWGNYFQTPSMAPVVPYRFVDTARAYEAGGTANYPGATGLAASVQLILELGPDAIADHVYRLTDHLITGLDGLPVQVVSPRTRENRSGIVTFSLGSAEKNVRLMNQLLERRILVSVRYTSNVGGVRVSCHFFNNEDDMDALVDAVGKLTKA